MLKNRNHPKKGSSIASDPIRNIPDIAKIKENLRLKPRDLALFTLGINTNLRISDLLKLHVKDVKYLQIGDSITVKQQKRGKYGIRILNETAFNALQNWLKIHPGSDFSPLFPGKNPDIAITKQYASRLIKLWCKKAGLNGRFSAHSLRKTFGYHMIETFKIPLHRVQAAYGHRDSGTTLMYLGILRDDIREIYMNSL